MHLVQNYPSHDFIIDDEEAEGLFERVEEPSDLLYDLLASLGDMPYVEQSSPFVCALTGLQGESDGDEDEKESAVDQNGDNHRPSDTESSHERPTDNPADPIGERPPDTPSRQAD